MNVLIVEDDEHVAQLLFQTLKMDYSIRSAMSGKEALQLSEEEPLPDLVLLDIGLPDMDGFKVLQAFKSSPLLQNIPVIFLTGNVDDRDEATGLAMGAVDYIRKPVNISLLKARIASHLELKKHRDELEDLVARRTDKLSESERRLRMSLKEKELLLKEIHHRVKNNLQIISSLLSLQAHYVKDPEDFGLFQESRDRIRSMALVHEELYRSGDFGKVNIKEYITRLTRELLGTIGGGKKVATDITVEDIQFPMDIAIPCGLIINELLTNCLKHAFSGQDEGRIALSISEKDGRYVLSVKDNGSGFPEGIDFEDTESLGMELIINLVTQLKGTIEIHQEHPGTRFVISFPAA